MDALADFYYKVYNLAVHLARLYGDPIFKLDIIERDSENNEFLVLFVDVRSGRQMSKSVKEIFENKKLLKNFSAVDAATIGYTYGRAQAISGGN